jgi:hypothetical protein
MVRFDPPHPYSGDVEFQLAAPGQLDDFLTLKPSNFIGGGGTALSGPYYINDGGNGILGQSLEALSPGTYRAPRGINNFFRGRPLNGRWTLSVWDAEPFDTGTIAEAKLFLYTTENTGQPALISDTSGNNWLQLSGAVPGASYDLLRSSDLIHWSPEGTATADSFGFGAVADTAPSSRRWFYKFAPLQ